MRTKVGLKENTFFTDEAQDVSPFFDAFFRKIIRNHITTSLFNSLRI